MTNSTNGCCKEEVVRFEFYFNGIQDIFEYSEATFGIKAAFSFLEDLKKIVRDLEY